MLLPGVLCLAAMLPLSGCESTPLVWPQSLPALRESRAWHGKTPLYATYRFGVLRTELPPGHSIEAINAAMRGVLYRQGHTIEEASVSPQGGRLVALASRELPYDRVQINTSFEGGGIVMKIKVSPADENRARVVFETILQALDL